MGATRGRPQSRPNGARGEGAGWMGERVCGGPGGAPASPLRPPTHTTPPAHRPYPPSLCSERQGVVCSVIGVPKSIDNDILLIDKCFGFDTAVEEAQRALLAAKVEASSAFRGVGVVKLMGRQSGFIALQASTGARVRVRGAAPSLQWDTDLSEDGKPHSHRPPRSPPGRPARWGPLHPHPHPAPTPHPFHSPPARRRSRRASSTCASSPRSSLRWAASAGCAPTWTTCLPRGGTP